MPSPLAFLQYAKWNMTLSWEQGGNSAKVCTAAFKDTSVVYLPDPMSAPVQVPDPFAGLAGGQQIDLSLVADVTVVHYECQRFPIQRD